ENEAVTVDPEDPTRYTVTYALGPDLPVRTQYRLRVTGTDVNGKIGEGVTTNFGIGNRNEMVYVSGPRPMRAIFADYCQTCHSGTTPQGNLRLEYYDQPFTN